MSLNLFAVKRIIILALFSSGIFTWSHAENNRTPGAKPTHIIFMIGDGMGLSAVSTTFYFGDGISVFSDFPVIGLINTSSATHKVTESAASGTAMSSGTKTYNGAIGVDTDRHAVKNITEVVTKLGWSTGVISTSSITHATPATFYAHVLQRSMEEWIASQLVVSGIDFFAGGGIQFFTKRSDGFNLLPTAASQGFIIDTSSLATPGSLDPGKKYGFLLAPDGMPTIQAGRGDFLPSATALAIEYLSNNENGFFLMVEGSQIDWAGHNNDTEYLVSEMLDFEKTIAVALEFARKDGNTLVVVTADHETGGFALGPGHNEKTGTYDYSVIDPLFATGSHTATLIPVFAYGPGAEKFSGLYQNTELFHKMVKLASGE